MSLIYGLLFGMTLQLAVGPVFFAVLHKSIKEGAGEALKMTSGVALVDAFYIILSFTGVGALLQMPALNRLVFWGGAAVLIFFGLHYFRGGQPQAAAEAAPAAGGGSLLYGVKLTLTNPLTILFWAGAFGALIGSGSLKSSADIILYAGGCVLATLLFLGGLSLAARNLAAVLSGKSLKYLDYAVGTFLILFGLGMLIR